MPRTIKISAGYQEINPIFHLRRITQEEESEFFAKLAASADLNDPAAKEAHHFECSREALKSWAAERLTKGIGDGTEPFFGNSDSEAGSPAHEIDRYLNDCAARGEDIGRIVRAVVNQYLERLQPAVNFW